MRKGISNAAVPSKEVRTRMICENLNIWKAPTSGQQRVPEFETARRVLRILAMIKQQAVAVLIFTNKSNNLGINGPRHGWE